MSGIWFCGDVHGEFEHVLKTVEKTPLGERPAAVIFLGDLDPQEPLSRVFKRFLDLEIEPWFVHGNHEGDHADTWANTLDCWHRNLNGRVKTIAGIRVAGLGGVFRKENWYPPAKPKFGCYDEYIGYLKSIQPKRLREDVLNSKRARVAAASIYPYAMYDLFLQHRADLLVTHEAPGCCRDGFSVIDDLARDLKVEKIFSGHHHHDNHTSGNGFESFQVGLRGIRELSGRTIKIGESE